MKRFVLSPTEDAVLLYCLGEYMAARRARDVANRTLAATEEAIQTAVDLGDRHRAQAERQSRGLVIEQREIARETIRLMTGIMGILRRQS